MTMVLDASAVLAFIAGEPGADVVEEALAEPTVCSAVNWSEVAQKVTAGGGDWSVASALLTSYGLTPLDATAQDGETAAGLWQRGSGLSLADRFCLALAGRLDAVALTADTAWGTSQRVRQIR